MRPANNGYSQNSNQPDYYNVNDESAKTTHNHNPHANKVLNEESKKVVNVKIELKDSSDDSDCDSDSNTIDLIKDNDKNENNLIVKGLDNFENNNLVKRTTKPSSQDTKETSHEENSKQNNNIPEETSNIITEQNDINHIENRNNVQNNLISVKSVDRINNEFNKVVNVNITKKDKARGVVDLDIDCPGDLMNGICVYNIPLALQDQHLVEFFERYGEIKKFKFFNCKAFTMSKYCYISFGNRLSAKSALEANGLIFQEHIFQVYLRFTEKHSTKVITVHCPKDITIEELHNTFESCGPILFVTLKGLKDNTSAMAYVKFEMAESINVAILESFTIRNKRVKAVLTSKTLKQHREEMK